MTGGGYGLELDDVEHARLRRQAAGIRGIDPELWELAGVGPGADVADLGCGPAAMLLELRGLVGPDGTLTGVDSSAEAVERGRAAVAEQGVRNVVVRLGDATGSGLPAASFDAVLVVLVLIHNGGREREIVAHAASLLRPGGSVFLLDLDATSVRVQPPVALMSEMGDRFAEYQEALGSDRSVGLKLPELVEGAGLELTDFRGFCRVRRRTPGERSPSWAARRAMVQAGVISDDDVDRWAGELAKLDRESRQPWITGCGYTAVGRRT